MSYHIKYKDKWTGEERTKVCENSRGDAEAWTKSLSEDNGCKAVCREVGYDHYNNQHVDRHILSTGDGD